MIKPILFHIWGPLSIHVYGLCIALGILLTFFLIKNDQKTLRIISFPDLITIIQLMIISGYLGGRTLCLASEAFNQEDILLIIKFWEPGLSILGCILGIFITLFLFLWIKNIPVLKITDRIVVYSPLIQSLGRIGCFFAGCCYGQATTAWWSVTYNHPDHMAPLGIALHPTQLYSSLLLFCIFIILYFFLQHYLSKTGLLTCTYFLLISAERFIVDFLRWDRTWTTMSGFWSLLSINQWIALSLFFSSICGIIYINFSKNTKHGFI